MLSPPIFIHIKEVLMANIMEQLTLWVARRRQEQETREQEMRALARMNRNG